MKPVTYLSLIFLSSWLSVMAQDNHYLITGSYTRGKSTGMYVFHFNTGNGSALLVDSMPTSNPSYLVVSPGNRFVYAVSEVSRGQRNGKVRAFSFDQHSGKLQYLNEQPSVGDNPCYVTMDKKGKWVIVGNYSSGTLAVLPVQKDGSLGPPVSSAEHFGKSVHPRRQEASHVHAVVLSPDDRFLYVPDLGKDKLMVYSFNSNTGALKPAKDSAIRLADGSGPRHFEFHPSGKWAYLVQELSGTVTSFKNKRGKLRNRQTISTLPQGYSLPFTSADIHVSPDGKFLYASNRDSSNTIAIFSIDQKSGQLKLQGHQSTLGRTPRNFNFDPSGNFLLVANQNSDMVVVFRIDHATGLLSDTGQRIETGNPVCIKWAGKVPLH